MLTLTCLSIALSVTFVFMLHPLSVLVIIIVQTLTIMIMTGLLNLSYWFSFILFLIFIGGMLVLFIYVASLASNEIFSKTSIIKMTKILLLSFLLSLLISLNFYTKSLFDVSANSNIEISMIVSKFYLHNFPITLMIIIYLLITLFAVVHITKFNKGPLRTNK